MYFTVRKEPEEIIIISEVDSPPKNENLFIKVDDKTGATINASLLCGKIVSMDYSGELNVVGSDKFRGIPISDTDRVSTIKKAERDLNDLVNSISMIDYINYIDINNELNNLGFFITDTNREEKYLEILETGNEHIIDVLEALLILKDKLSVVKSAKDKFDNILESVMNLTEDDKEELKKLYNS